MSMAETDEIEVSMSESVDREADVEANSVELMGSDVPLYTPTDETAEREVVVTSKELEEMDGMLIWTKHEDHISISSGGVKLSHNVRQRVAWFEYPDEYRIQISHYLCLLCDKLTTKLTSCGHNIGFNEEVDFNKNNIFSVKPTNKEPNKSPNTVFTVTLCHLTCCPGTGLLVQIKPGNHPTEPPNLVGTPSPIPSPKPKN